MDHEWEVYDKESLMEAMNAIKAWRKFSFEDLFRRMGSHLLNRFLRGKQAQIQTETIFKFLQATDMVMVIRAPRKSKTKQRLDVLRAEREAAQVQETAKAEQRKNEAEGRDAQGKLNRPLTEAEKAEAEALLAQYSRY